MPLTFNSKQIDKVVSIDDVKGIDKDNFILF